MRREKTDVKKFLQQPQNDNNGKLQAHSLVEHTVFYRHEQIQYTH